MIKNGSILRLTTMLLTLGMFAIGSISCVKKGEEDPIISFRSRTNRLTGHWELQTMQINSQVDLMNYAVPGISEVCQKEFMNASVIHDFMFDFRSNGEVDFMFKSEDRTFNLDSCMYEESHTEITNLERWTFNDDETILQVSNDAGQNNTHVDYDIVGLSNSEMTLSFDVVANFILDADGNILHYDAPQVYTATLVFEKSN